MRISHQSVFAVDVTARLNTRLLFCVQIMGGKKAHTHTHKKACGLRIIFLTRRVFFTVFQWSEPFDDVLQRSGAGEWGERRGGWGWREGTRLSESCGLLGFTLVYF